MTILIVRIILTEYSFVLDAVQGRELTQLQTALQDQIRKHGDHVFEEGAMVLFGTN